MKFKCLLAVVLSCALGLAVLAVVWEVFSPWGYVFAAALVVISQLGIALRQIRLLWRAAAQIAQSKGAATNPYELGVVVNAVFAIRERFPGLEIPTSTWSMTFPNLLVLLDVLDARMPVRVVEFGSGISSLCVGSWLREKGRGKLISVDHDAGWAKVTRRHVQKLGCEEFVEVVVAPLERQESLGGELWYDLGPHLEKFEGGVDLVIVDGPPNGSGGLGLARLPVLGVLEEFLADGAVVLVDDALREGEKEMIRIWQRQFPGLDVKTINVGTGIAIIEWQEDVIRS